MPASNPVSKQLHKWQSKRSKGEIIYCALCHEICHASGDPKGMLTVDHIIPKALGGTNIRTNLQPAHKICNLKRGDLIMEEFRGAQTNEQIVARAIAIIDHARTVSLEELLRKV